MNTEYFTFEGKAEWAFVNRPHKKFNPAVYMMNFYPKDEDTRRAVKATGIRNGVNEGPYGWYYVLRRLEAKGPIKVTLSDGTPFEGMIGNGSDVRVKLEVYTFDDGKNRGKGSRIDSIEVTNLVPYVSEKTKEINASLDSKEQAAEEAQSEALKVEVPKVTKKVPF